MTVLRINTADKLPMTGQSKHLTGKIPGGQWMVYHKDGPSRMLDAAAINMYILNGEGNNLRACTIQGASNASKFKDKFFQTTQHFIIAQNFEGRLIAMNRFTEEVVLCPGNVTPDDRDRIHQFLREAMRFLCPGSPPAPITPYAAAGQWNPYTTGGGNQPAGPVNTWGQNPPPQYTTGGASPSPPQGQVTPNTPPPQNVRHFGDDWEGKQTPHPRATTPSDLLNSPCMWVVVALVAAILFHLWAGIVSTDAKHNSYVFASDARLEQLKTLLLETGKTAADSRAANEKLSANVDILQKSIADTVGVLKEGHNNQDSLLADLVKGMKNTAGELLRLEGVTQTLEKEVSHINYAIRYMYHMITNGKQPHGTLPSLIGKSAANNRDGVVPYTPLGAQDGPLPSFIFGNQFDSPNAQYTNHDQSWFGLNSIVNTIGYIVVAWVVFAVIIKCAQKAPWPHDQIE
jgi:hypothetical protein